MSFGEVAGAAVVLIVVVSSMINRAKAAAKTRVANPGFAAFEAMAERSESDAAPVDLRAMLEAARAAKSGTARSVEPSAVAVDLGEILAAARAAKRSHAPGAERIDARALIEAAKKLQVATVITTAGIVSSESPTPHKKNHRGQHVAPQRSHVAPFDGARPPLAEMPILAPLHALRALHPHASMQPLAPLDPL